MPRAALSLVLVTPDALYRADYSAGGRRCGLERLDRPAIDDFGLLVEMALQPGRSGRHVWVAATEFWTQVLTLPPEMAFRKLSPADTARALAFEAEADSGQSALAVHAAVRDNPGPAGPHRYWLTTVPAYVHESIDQSVRDLGKRLAGCFHPAGMAGPVLKSTRGRAWQRIELWPDAVAAIRQLPGQPLSVDLWNTDPRLGHWLPDVLGWLAAGPADLPLEVLAAESIPVPPDLAQASAITLGNPDGLAAWFDSLAAALKRKAPTAPTLTPIKRPVSVGVRFALAAALTAAMLGGVWYHHQTLERQTDAWVSQAKRLDEPAKLIPKVEQNLAALRKQQAELEQQLTDLDGKIQRTNRVLDTHRRRFADLLLILGERLPAGVVLREVTQSSGQTQLAGVATSPDAIHQLGSLLASMLPTVGWQIEGPDHQARVSPLGPSLWEFQIVLREVEPDATPTRREAGTETPTTASAAPIPPNREARP